MAIRYKVDIIKELKNAGYSSYRIRQEKTFGQSILTAFRKGEAITWVTLDSLCKILHCQPGDLLEYVENESEDKQSKAQEGTPNVEQAE